jgi:hypothetical protein
MTAYLWKSSRKPARPAFVIGIALIVGMSGAWAASPVSAETSAAVEASVSEESEDAVLRAMIESRTVTATIPDAGESADHVGGPISPNFTGTFVKTAFSSAGVRPLRMPDVGKAPSGSAGALIQVTTHSKGAPVTVWAEGTPAPLLKVPSGGVTSTSTVVRWGQPFNVRTSAKADVYVVVHGWILDDPGAGIAAGGVGLAETRVPRLDTRKGQGPRWLAQATGREIQLTGLGGMPTKTSGVVVEAYLEPRSGAEVALEMGAGGQWRELSRLTSRNPVTQLLVLPVREDGTVALRSTAPLNARLTPLAWLSAGQAWTAPEQAGGFVAIRPDAVNDGALGKGGVFDVPGIPDATNVIAAVSGQAFGDGQLRITTAGASAHSVTLPVRGPSTGLLLIPEAEKGARISLQGSLEATVHVVGYVRVAQPTGRVTRSARPITLRPDLVDGAKVSIAETGVLSVRGSASSDVGIQDVAITMPGYPTFHAEVDHLTGTFTADLRPPAGTHTLTLTATDSEGGTTSVKRTVTVTTPGAYDDILSERAVSLNGKAKKQITRVARNRILASQRLLDGQGRPITAGAVLLSSPFAASDEGLSRLITAEEVRPEGVVYYTRAPKMNEIFEQASLGVDDDSLRTPRLNYFNDNVSIDYTLPYNFKKDWGSGALTGSVWLNAEASGNVWIKLVIGSSWYFPQLDFLDITGTHRFKADAGANADLDYKSDIYSSTPFQSTVMAGPVPVVITVPLRVYLDLQGSVEVTAYAETTATWRVLYTRDEMWGAKGWRDLEWEFDGPRWRINGEYSADMRIGVEIRPRVTLAEALGVAGPVDFTLLGLKGAGEMEADSNGKREYTCTEPLTLYSNVSMGLDFTLIGDKYRWAIIEKSEVVDLVWWKQSGCST